MSTKLQTSSAILFDKLVGDPYIDGAVTVDTCAHAEPSELTPKVQTMSAILFDKLIGDPYTDGSLRTHGGDTGLNPATIVQEGQQANMCNNTSPSTAGVYITKGLFTEHFPYSEENDPDLDGKIIVFHYHFLKELRRQLSIEVDYSLFSPAEQKLFDEYVSYLNGNIEYPVAKLIILNELDFWLVEEIKGNVHPAITRGFSDLHVWKKIETRDIEEL